MNREIKFRAFENEEGRNRMFNWNEVKKEFDQWLNRKDTFVMQFIGIVDCNGRDIYEGDICLIKFDIDKVEDYIYNSLSIVEKNSGQKIFAVESPIFNNQPELNADYIEVIGNIYETPELLTELS